MMKRGRERPRKNPYNDEDAEFFKVFIPSRNSRQLKIPMSFVKEFGATIHEKTTLKGHDGKLWNVDIEYTREGVFMKNGWHYFVNHYSLSVGQFLVFKYIGNSTFMVSIFGIDRCKIEARPMPSIVREVKSEEESEIKKSCEISCSSKQPKSSNKAKRVSSQVVQREPVVTEDPYFIKPVNYKQTCNLIIPKEMFVRHGVWLRKEMVLQNEKGETWPVNICKCADGRVVLGGGWLNFWKQNGVRPCDACKFTFLKGGSSKVIEVEILQCQAK